ncbi:hypothetical protein [Methylobacillus sp. Pita1]|uniref:hypothetical protein n=1 Tax=Methylobacillus sp. Pita1 TaxID=3382642 RepID=UPI0038B4D20C
MGQAKRREKEILILKQRNTVWLDSLKDEERKITEVVLNAHKKIIEGMGMVGGCYYMTGFLYLYLKRELGIYTNPVVGYVNDGESELMISHAWLEYEGKIIDITITRTEVPEIQIEGSLLILDHEWKKGKGKYSYHYDKTDFAKQADSDLAQSEFGRKALRVKEDEHLRMHEMMSNDDEIEKYLNSAPHPQSYISFSKVLS